MAEFCATKNPTDAVVAEIIRGSAQKAARQIIDPATGDRWVWAAEIATHAEGAKHLGVAYDRKPGEGDILIE